MRKNIFTNKQKQNKIGWQFQTITHNSLVIKIRFNKKNSKQTKNTNDTLETIIEEDCLS